MARCRVCWNDHADQNTNASGSDFRMTLLAGHFKDSMVYKKLLLFMHMSPFFSVVYALHFVLKHVCVYVCRLFHVT